VVVNAWWAMTTICCGWVDKGRGSERPQDQRKCVMPLLGRLTHIFFNLAVAWSFLGRAEHTGDATRSRSE